MVCISELRGLQNFQARHPETIVVAMNVLEHEHAKDAIDRLIKKQKLDMLAWHKANNGGTTFTRRD